MMNNPNEMMERDDQYQEQVISVDRVARVVKGGRRFRFRSLVVVGDKKGKVGVGVAKGADVQSSITKAVQKAKQSLIDVKITDKGTIYHDALHKVAGAKVMIRPANPGTGIIAGGVVRAVIELAGISDILSKSIGSSNKINVAYATLGALQDVVPKDQWLSSREGK